MKGAWKDGKSHKIVRVMNKRAEIEREGVMEIKVIEVESKMPLATTGSDTVCYVVRSFGLAIAAFLFLITGRSTDSIAVQL